MTDPVVLIAPAMAIGSRFYTPVVRAFDAHGWTARALPRRGFEDGDAPASRRNNWSYEDEIDVIAGAVAEARAEQPERPVLVLGHSLGAQLAAGHQLTRAPADGVVSVAGCLPHHMHYPAFGPHIVVMGLLMVPTMTTALGYVPPPLFGAPGARTLMRQWARMALTGRPPFPARTPITTPSLLVTLEGDTYAPERAVDAFARRLFAPTAVTRWTYRIADVPDGASNDHIRWARDPQRVVDRVVSWWGEQQTS